MMRKKAEWLTDKYILLMCLVFPLWTGFSGYASVTFSKYLFFAAATGLWLAGLLICAVLGRLRPGKLRLPAAAALAFMLAACLSALLSPFGSSTLLGAARWDGLVTLLLYGGIFLGVSAFGRPSLRYVRALAVSSAGCCAVALLQLAGRNPLGLFPDGLTYYDAGVRYSGEFLGTLGNADVLAAYFCLCIPLFAGTAALPGPRRRLLFLAPAALCAYVLARAGVASGAVALAGCLLVSFPCFVALRTKKRAATWAAVAVSAVCLAAATAVIYHWSGGGTLGELSSVLHGKVEDSFGSSRILIWRETLRLVKERPLLGGGPDTLGLRSTLDFSRVVPETGRTLTTHVDNAHNEFLGYLVNVGAAGLVPYLALCLTSLVRWLRGCAPAFGAALFCYFIQSFFGLGLCLVVPIVWIFMGLLHAPGEELP